MAFDEHVFVMLIGLIGGAGLGLAARMGRFCTLGAIEDALYGNDLSRLRMWGVAIVTAIFGAFYLRGTGTFERLTNPYLDIQVMVAGSVLGGLLFGYGMALTGSCAFGALARIGGGDFRGLIVALVLGVSAYFTISGPFAIWREMLFPVELAAPEYQGGYADWIAAQFDLSVTLVGYAMAAILGVIVLSGWKIRENMKSILWGIIVGLSVTLGWAGTAYVAQTGFEQIALGSFTFASSSGETMLFLMQGSARPMSFALGGVFGVILGAVIGSVVKGEFRWEGCEDPRELRRQIMGAVLMGVGAVLAGGCTIGQGVSAMAMLSYGAPLTLASIFLAAAFGLRQLISGFSPAA